MDGEHTPKGAAEPHSRALATQAALTAPARLATPWPWGWNVLGTSLVFQAVTFGVTISSFTFFVERWSEDFGVPRSEIMLAATLGAIMPALLGPVAGRAMDTLPARRVIAGGLAALALAFALLAQVTAVWHVILIYAFVTPIAAAFAGATPAQVLAARWFPNRRGFAIGLASTGLSLGGVVIPPLVVFLIAAAGWRMTFGVFCLFTALFILPLVLLVVRSGPDGEDPKRFPEPQHAASSGIPHTMRTILRERNFWVLFFFLFPIGMALIVIQFNLAGLSAERGVTIRQAGLLISIMSMVLLLAKFIWGYLADRVEHRVLFAAMALMDVAGCFAVSMAEGFLAMCASLMVVGLATGGLLPLVGAALSHQFGSAFGRAFGLVTMSLPLTLVGPPIAARLQEHWGSYTPVLMAVAAFTACSVVVALFLEKKSQPFEGKAAASISSTPSAVR